MQWQLTKQMESVFGRVFTKSREVTEAKQIISVTVDLFILIRWTSRQVSQHPTLIWPLQGRWINQRILSRILSACVHRDKEHRQIWGGRAAWLCCSNINQ